MLRITDTYRVHNDCLVALAFCPNGQTIVSTTEELDEDEGDLVGVLKVWQRGGSVRFAFRDARFTGVLALSDNGRWAIWGGHDGQVGLLNLSLGRLEVVEMDRRSKSSPEIVPNLFLPKSSTLVWTATHMESAKLFDVDSRRVIGEIGDSGYFCAAVTPDGRHLCFGSLDSELSIWDRVNGRQLTRFSAQPEGVHAVAMHPTKQLLATCGHWKGGIKIWDYSAPATPRCLFEDPAIVNDLKFLPDGRLITGCESGDLCLWDIEAYRCMTRASTADLGGLKLVEEDDQITVTHNKPGVSEVAVSPDGRTIAAGTYGGAVAFYSVSG